MPYLLIALIAGVLCLLVLIPLATAERQMRATGGPGIISLELAESELEVGRYLRTWGAPGRRAAMRSLWWDFPFIACYVTALGAAGLYLARRADHVGYGWLAVAEMVVAGAAAVAGALDVAEGVALLRQVSANRASHGAVLVARWSAQIKFGLIGIVGVALLVGYGILQLAG